MEVLRRGLENKHHGGSVFKRRSTQGLRGSETPKQMGICISEGFEWYRVLGKVDGMHECGLVSGSRGRTQSLRAGIQWGGIMD